ncbi:mariner Mos1 transposase [Trichonephila clavipes]|nr:mariner Mos1 transposase [Trichonephila clavipes]
MHRVCQHIVLRKLNENRVELVEDLILAIDKDLSLMGRIVTGDEKWCFLYNPQSKRTWNSPQPTLKQKFCRVRSKGKVILEVFFHNQDIGHLEFIHLLHTVRTEYVIQRHLRESIRKKRPKLGAEQSRVLLHHNAPARPSLLVTEFPVKEK